MPTITDSPEKLINLKTPNSIWEHLQSENKIQYFWLGQQPYQPIWNLQKQLHAKRVSGEILDIVLLLEHDHVYTLGKNADPNHLLDSNPRNAEVIQIDRGGEVTYHGPGQLVCYPIIDLHNYQMSVSWYMRTLENVVISCMKEFGIESKKKDGLPGVWVDDDKICAMGVRLSKWVTMHGFALNLNPDMTYFDGMIPCGIFEYGVTSFNDLQIEYKLENILTSIVKTFSYFLSMEQK